MQTRIIHPIPNLLSIYHLEVINVTNAFCGSVLSLKVYVEYLEKSLKEELRKRRKIKNYCFGEEQRTPSPTQSGRSSSPSPTPSNTCMTSRSSMGRSASKTYSSMATTR